ncbi:MAG TPA: hypothetical protein VFF69_15905 [Phycisphaerales bacterium]|nr:hypothetical protein [Phycisphaerales bacterium]
MPSARDLLVVALSLVIYAILRRLYFRVCRLPERAYRSRCIVGAACRRPAFAALGVATVAPVAMLARGVTWGSLEDGGLLRLVVATAAGVLAWTNATIEINAYHGREHLLDRALVLILGALVAVHPAFTPAFLIVMMPVWRQVTHPEAVAEAITDKLLVVDVVVAFVAFLQVHVIVGAATWHYMVVAMGLVAMHYFHPGWSKVRLGPRPWSWVVGNRLSDLTMNAWVLGHLGFLPAPTVGRAGRLMRPLDVPIQCATLALELAAIALLADRTLAIGLLLGFVVMHAAILAASGLAFWKWSALDLALVVFLLGAGPAVVGPLFSPPALAASIAIAVLGRLHSTPAPLGWFDSRLVETFRYEVVGADGRVYALPNNFCAPYDQAFSQGRFAYLYDRPALVATHGVIRARRGAIGALALRRLIDRTGGDPRKIDRLRRRYGVRRFDADRARRFDDFVRRYFGFIARTGRRRTPFSWLPHPKHFWHWTRGEAYRMQAPAAALRVRYLAVFTEPGNIRVVEDRIVREVEIPGQPVSCAPAAPSAIVPPTAEAPAA